MVGKKFGFDEPVGDLLKRKEPGLTEAFERFVRKNLEEALRGMGWRPSEDNPDVWVAPKRDVEG